jgi:C2 domain
VTSYCLDPAAKILINNSFPLDFAIVDTINISQILSVNKHSLLIRIDSMATTETHADVANKNASAQKSELEPETTTQNEAGQSNDSQINSEDMKENKHEKKPSDSSQGEKSKDEKQPPGGFSAAKIPPAPPGYTIKITIHRAENLPMADINSLSSDPYVDSQLYTSLPTRHKDDPPLTMRTFTIRRCVNPEWRAEWIVANVPANGFRLKCRLYDEDPGDHDDRLGNAHVEVPSLSETWEGFTERSFKIKKRMGSKRAYLAQALAAGTKLRKSMSGHLILSIQMLGKTESSHGGRVYTVGPMFWTKHYSPVLGRIVGKKTPGKESNKDEEEDKVKTERYK